MQKSCNILSYHQATGGRYRALPCIMEQPTLSEIYRLLTAHVDDSKKDRHEMNEKLDAIQTQVIKTNGRVNRLEEDNTASKGHIDSLRLWRNLLIGGGIVISALGIMFLKLYESNVINKAAEIAVSKLEAKYEIQIK